MSKPETVTALPQANSSSIVPMDPLVAMIERAARDPSIDMDRMDRLLAMKERAELRQSTANFEEAVAAAKREMPVIIKNATGHNNKKYANFAAIASVVDPILGKNGLSYRFRTNQSEKGISVTCILFGHGHSEETTLSGPADASGSKNAIQAIGSTLTYLQRYSLVQMLGLAAAEDDDGNAAGMGETISNEQCKRLTELVEETKADVAAFCKVLKVANLSDLPVRQFDSAMALLKTKKAMIAKEAQS